MGLGLPFVYPFIIDNIIYGILLIPLIMKGLLLRCLLANEIVLKNVTMKIESIMSRSLITVALDTELGILRHRFSANKIHHLLVVDGWKLKGVISDRDVLKHLSPYADSPAEMNRDAFTLQKKAHQIMSRDVVSVSPQDSIVHAAQLLLDHQISCLPVLDDQEKVEGVVTWRDLLRHSYNIRIHDSH